jgi:hypothetical protein
MCCFIVEPLLDIGFEMSLEADATVWHSDIDSVYARGFSGGF